MTMELSQVKVRGLQGLENTGWLSIHPHITLIESATAEQAQHFLAALETINPVRDIKQSDPFSTYLPFTKLNGHTRRIAPEKKTAAYGIFIALPQLVHKLGYINTMFYETDRIEVGRRLDFSRWISFVELPGSSKIEEFEKKAAPIFAALSQQQREEYENLVSSWQFNDRISGQLAIQLREWWINTTKGSSERALSAECLKIIELEHETNKARNIVEGAMPFTLFIDHSSPLKTTYTIEQLAEEHHTDSFVSFLCQMKDALFPASATERSKLKTEIENITDKFRQDFVVPEIIPGAGQLLISGGKNTSHCIDRILIYLILAKASHLQSPVFLIDLDGVKTPSNTMKKLNKQLGQLSAQCQLIIHTSNKEYNFTDINYRPIRLPALAN